MSAVRNAGLHMGLYYSGGLDWTFTQKPIVTMEDLMARVPQTEEYARYADAHWTELTDRYRPAVMWNDISYPKAGRFHSSSRITTILCPKALLTTVSE